MKENQVFNFHSFDIEGAQLVTRRMSIIYPKQVTTNQSLNQIPKWGFDLGIF